MDKAALSVVAYVLTLLSGIAAMGVMVFNYPTNRKALLAVVLLVLVMGLSCGFYFGLTYGL